MFGYAGNILRVNLTKGQISQENISDYSLEENLGGRTLGAKILLNELKPGIDPLGPENKLIFITGPVTGFKIPGNSRYMVISKSPLTGIWGEGTSGGFFAPELKKAGYDMIIIEGKAPSPSMLWIKDKEVKLLSAQDLWGLTTSITEKKIREKLGNKGIRVACIGPAGEKLVKIASIINEEVDAVGRCGLGAVMGSKNLKAIAVKGNRIIKAKDEIKTKKISQSIWGKVKEVPFVQRISELGTSAGPINLSNQGELPTKNFQKTVFQYANDISLNNGYQIKSKTCWGCPIACKKFVYVNNRWYKAPEYETEVSLGSFCLNRDYLSIFEGNMICNEYGIDTISAGSVIAFAMECYENGILSQKETDGLTLSWGNPKIILELLMKIVNKEGIGELLSNGVKKASQELGRNSEFFAMHVKGLEIPMHTPRTKKGYALSCMTAVKGGSHMESPMDYAFQSKNSIPELSITESMEICEIEGKPEAIKKTQDKYGMRDAMILCAFPFDVQVFTLKDCSRLIYYLSGMDLSEKDLLKVGERGLNLARIFSIRESLTGDDDYLPRRFEDSLPEGLFKGQRLSRGNMKKMLQEYYRLRGWSVNGVPTSEKLKELKLDYAIKELKN